MALNWNELEILISELGPSLEGSGLQKFSQASEFAAGEAFVLTGYNGKFSWKLIIAVDRENTALFLSPKGHKIKLSKEPNTFVMMVRKTLLGSQIKSVEQLPQDRMVLIHLQNKKTLLIELMPKRGNLVLLEDWDAKEKTGRAIAYYRRISLESGAIYRLVAASSYQAAKVRDFSDFGSDYYSERVAQYFVDTIEASDFNKQLKALAQSLKSRRKKIETAIKKNQSEMQKAKELETVRFQAKILHARLYELGPKNVPATKMLSLEDFEGNTLEVEVDPRHNFAKNSDRLFRQVKKYERAEQELENQSLELMLRLEQCKDIAEAISTANSISDLHSIESALQSAGISAGKNKKQQGNKAQPFVRLYSSQGFDILCGRNQKENRLVTLKEARGNDLWLHLRGTPGAHVVIKSKKQKTIPLETIVEAAQVVLYYSKVRKDKKVEVDYTLKKFVKPIKGTIASVNYTENKTLYLELDQDVVKKVLSQRK